MVDPVGTAIGLVGLFSTCLEGWRLIEDGRSMGREFVIQRQRYLNLRLRFVLWGEACGLDICNRGDDGYIPQSIRSNILGTLGCIANLFEDGDELKHRYGLDSDMTLPEHPETSNPTDFSMLQVLTDQYNRFEQRIKRVKGHTGRLGTVRWAVSDRTRFTTLINHLKELVADLETLTMGIGSCQKQRQLVDREMKRIIDLSELQIIEEAGQDDDDPVSDAASARISTLRTQPSGTSNRSYHTVAYTGPTSILAAIEPVKSVPDISPDSQWQRILASLRTGKPSFQQNILVDESKCGDLLLWVKARHLLSELPEKFSRPRAKEIREVASAIVPWVDGWPIGGDLHDFISAIEGPLGTPYEGSVFYLRITLASRHPFRPPDCRFLTKIYHPNVNPSGQICSDLFNSGWSPAFTLTSILVAISGLLTSPNIEDPFVPEIATIYIQEPQTYEQYAFEHAAQHANPRLYPVVDADKGITFQMCNTSLEELICCLANRAVDDAFMLVTKYRCQSLSFSKELKGDPVSLKAEWQICDDIITLSQRIATFFSLVRFDKTQCDIRRCISSLKRSLSWLEDLLLHEHEAQKPFKQKPGNDFTCKSENTAWLIWALNASLINFRNLLTSESSDLLEC